MSATIKDVARAAGVSASTVSRVLNKKGVISKETEEKIYAVMKELNYVPNETARSFAYGNSMSIALVIDVKDTRSYHNSFFNNSVFGIETISHLNSYSLMIINGNHDDQDNPAEKAVLSKKIDGLILPGSMVRKDFVRKLEKLDFPYVILGQPPFAMQESSWVDINNVQGGAIAANHLFEKGYQNIAFLSSGENEVFNQNRIEGYREAHLQTCRPLSSNHVRHCTSSMESGFSVADEMLKQNDAPDAFICSDHYLAIGAKRAAVALGKSIPKDIGIMCFDNSAVAELADPPMTVVDIDTYSLGEQAASILLDKIKDRNLANRQTFISTSIIERNSTQR